MVSTTLSLAARILTATAAALALLASASPSVAHAQTRTLSYAAANPPGDTGINRALHWWANEIHTRTNGTLKIEFHFMGSLLKLADAVEGISAGVADMGYVVPAYSQAKLPLWYLSTTSQGPGDEWVVNEAFRRVRARTPEILAEEERNNFKYIAHYSLGAPVLLSKSRPYLSPADFRGDKVRLPGAYAAAARQAGWRVTSVNLTFPDVYSGIDRGTISGTMSYIIHVLPFRHNEVANHVVEPGLGQVTNVIFMNRRIWESLTPEQQQVIDDLELEFNLRLARGNIEDAEKARAELRNHPRYPMQLHRPSAEQLAAWDEGFKIATEQKLETISRWAPNARAVSDDLMQELLRVEQERQEKGYPWARN